MAKKTIAREDVAATPSILRKKPEPKKARQKAKLHRGLSAKELHELAAKHKPPQSWYDEDFKGLF